MKSCLLICNGKELYTFVPGFCGNKKKTLRLTDCKMERNIKTIIIFKNNVYFIFIIVTN